MADEAWWHRDEVDTSTWETWDDVEDAFRDEVGPVRTEDYDAVSAAYFAVCGDPALEKKRCDAENRHGRRCQNRGHEWRLTSGGRAAWVCGVHSTGRIDLYTDDENDGS
jgi:hypothetical protein